MKFAVLAVLTLLSLSACENATRSVTPRKFTHEEVKSSRDLSGSAILQEAVSHDPKLSADWQTIVIEEDGRTDRHAIVRLWAETGEEWRYEMVSDEGSWNVLSATRSKGGDLSRMPKSSRNGPLFDHSVSPEVELAIAYKSFDYQASEKSFLFVPYAGQVYDKLVWANNIVDYAEWYRPDPATINYNGEEWQSDFDSWQACMQDDFDTWICHSESEGAIYAIPGWNSGGSTVYAKQIWLSYSNTFIAPPDTAVASVSISPNPAFVRYGQSINVTATARNGAGEIVQGQTAAWSIEASSANVVSTGNLTAQVSGAEVGTATLTAIVQGEDGTATIRVDPFVELSGPAYAEDEGISITAASIPSGGSYYYEWSYSYCKNEPNDVEVCGSEPWYNGSSGQDATVYNFYMSPHYYYARFEVVLRESQSGRVLATDEIVVDGAGEEAPDHCIGDVCPEYADTTVVVK